MIDNNYTATTQTPIYSSKKALRMVESERMAGHVPVWDSNKTAKEDIAAHLAVADSDPYKAVDNALSYTTDNGTRTKADEEFGFGDILDMVNPLQHIPLVSSVYRHITGDDIKPISRIIGGAAYGGALGAASGLINVIAEHETGADLTGNVLSLATGKRHAKEQNALSDPAVLAMADLSYNAKYERHPYQYND